MFWSAVSMIDLEAGSRVLKSRTCGPCLAAPFDDSRADRTGQEQTGLGLTGVERCSGRFGQFRSAEDLPEWQSGLVISLILQRSLWMKRGTGVDSH